MWPGVVSFLIWPGGTCITQDREKKSATTNDKRDILLIFMVYILLYNHLKIKSSAVRMQKQIYSPDKYIRR